MARRILMTGNNAKYVNIHKQGIQQQDRDILLTGANAEYIEVTIAEQTIEKEYNKE